MKNEKKEYNIGLDIGTTSVGWSVVETDNQKIMRKGNKALWGVRLFEEAKTAADRRLKRSTRRRYDRRRQRLKLLQEEFKYEIEKIDKNFFVKLQESKYHKNDKINKTLLLENLELKEIKAYQNNYKTIYHLRNKLINDKSKEDIRLVYLAIHHIIKYRGNFLYQNSNFNIENLNIMDKLTDLFEYIVNNFPDLNVPENYNDIINLFSIEKILLNPSKNDVKVLLKESLEDIINKNFATEFGKLMVGNKANITKLLSIDNIEKLEIGFSGTEYEDKYDKCVEILGDNIEILDTLKELYDCIFIKKLFKGKENVNISELMCDYYEIHKKDLRFLKELFNNDRKLYDKLFRTKKDMCLYEKYTSNKIDYEEFKKELQKLLEKLFDNKTIKLEDKLINKYQLEVINRLENGTFLPRITTTDNGKYPYQLNKYELIKILENQGKFYPFLLNKLDDGTYKIVKLLEFKIPYYVGPLVNEKKSSNAWMERKVNNVKITPYNFDEVINKEKTAEKFIKRMISHCTYLIDENALTNNSILYSKFKVMNELKQIKINGEKILNNIQHKIIDEFFMNINGTLTETKFKKYLISSGLYEMYDDLKIIGYSSDNKFANNMQSYIDFFGENGIFINTNYNEDNAEEIIEWITIFEDKEILEKKVRNRYIDLSENQIKKILTRKYSGWGRLSKKLLTTKYYKDKQTETTKSIIDLMFETDKNFMQIINDDEYKFQNMIKELNNYQEKNKLDYNVVKELSTSPATKRGIYQSLKIVEEIVDYIGYEPKNIMIEMARNEDKKERKDTRKDYLKKLYEECKNQIEDYNRLKHELDGHEITSQRLFLYFIQEGKCLYSGIPLNLEDIENQSLYEIDHIIPRSLIKDDSIDNKALVLRECNQDKKANFILPKQFRNNKQIEWWKKLKKNKLISAKKFHNLVRNEYNEEDIQGFINRQLVETRQITKHVANILNSYHKKTKVIYLKAELSHMYREKYDLFKFREINDYHHAHDAYLAAVLGEYKEKYLRKNINFEIVKELNRNIIELDEGKKSKLKYGFVINSLDENLSNIAYKLSESMINKETGEILFDICDFNKKVENTLYRNDIIISKKVEYRTGKLFDETKNKKGKKGVPLKNNMPTNIYGSYTNINPSYAVHAKIIKNEKIIERLVGFPIYLVNKNESIVKDYYKNLFKLKNKDDIIINSKKIPFFTLLNWNNQICYLVGASDRVEVCNALELKFDKSFMIENKYALKKLLDKKYIKDVEDYELKLENIITYLVNKIEKEYVLFKNLVNDLKNIVKYEAYASLSIEEKENIIKQILNLLNCKSDNANFKFLNEKYSSAFGKKNCRMIEHAVIISKSITGIREKQYEF